MAIGLIRLPSRAGFHWVSVRAQRLLANSSRKDVRPLSEAEAIADGSELLSEAFVFVVAAGAITNEYIIAARKSNAKSEELDRTLDTLGASVSTLEQEVHLIMMEQQRQVERLNSELAHLTELLAQGKRPPLPTPPPAPAGHAGGAGADAKPASSCVIS